MSPITTKGAALTSRWPDDPVQRAFIVTWDNLPRILLLGLPATLGLLLLQVGQNNGLTLMTIPVIAVLVLPTCGGLAARYAAAISGDAFALPANSRSARRLLDNLLIASPAHFTGFATQAAVVIWSEAHHAALLLPVGVGLAGTTVAYTLAALAANEHHATGQPTAAALPMVCASWSAAMRLSFKHPTSSLALTAVGLLGCFAVAHLSFLGCIAVSPVVGIVLALASRRSKDAVSHV